MKINIATQHRTKYIINKYNLFAKKNYGQNFIINPSIIENIVMLSDISKDDYVIEIGPGIGALTEALVQVAYEVYAFEIDKDLEKVLKNEISNSNLHVTIKDFLKVDINELISKLDPNRNIVFVSNEAKNDLKKYYPFIEKKSITLNNIIDTSEIINNSNLGVKLKKNDFKNIAVFVGRMDDEVKKVSRIIELAKKCQQDKKDILFLLVGDGPDLLSLKVMVEEFNLNNVEFVGAQVNPYPYIKKANFLILTSKYEGFPVVYNEAIILDKPILSTVNVSDDEIEINGDFGIICKPEELYENIDNILNFKSKKIDIDDVNKKRIEKIEKLIGDLYEEKN